MSMYVYMCGNTHMSTDACGVWKRLSEPLQPVLQALWAQLRFFIKQQMLLTSDPLLYPPELSLLCENSCPKPFFYHSINESFIFL